MAHNLGILIFVGLKGYNEYIKHLCSSRTAVTSKTFRKSLSSDSVNINSSANDLTFKKNISIFKRQTVKEISQKFEQMLKH